MSMLPYPPTDETIIGNPDELVDKVNSLVNDDKNFEDFVNKRMRYLLTKGFVCQKDRVYKVLWRKLANILKDFGDMKDQEIIKYRSQVANYKSHIKDQRRKIANLKAANENLKKDFNDLQSATNESDQVLSRTPKSEVEDLVSFLDNDNDLNSALDNRAEAYFDDESDDLRIKYHAQH